MFHLLRTRITRPYCTSVALEEERVWVGFYRRVGNPAIAAEVIRHLDADADQKRAHPALYLRCKESLRRKKARQARAQRIRHFLRRMLGSLLRRSKSDLRPQRRPGTRTIVEGLAESMREPAQYAVKSRPQTAELATAQPDGALPNASCLPAPRLDASATAPRNAKAA